MKRINHTFSSRTYVSESAREYVIRFNLGERIVSIQNFIRNEQAQSEMQGENEIRWKEKKKKKKIERQRIINGTAVQYLQ